MIARLILLLLLAAFSLPATAAVCHDAPMPAAAHAMPTHDGDHHPAPDTPTAAHACVGCVPPSDLLGSRLAPRLVPASAPPTATVARIDAGSAQPPALPPPRRR